MAAWRSTASSATSTVRDVPPAERAALAAAFSPDAPLRAVVAAALDAGLGRAVASGSPLRAVRLSVGCYEIFGGAADPEAAGPLLSGIAGPRELVYGNDPDWRSLLRARFPSAYDRPMRSYDAGALSRARLEQISRCLPTGAALVSFDRRLSAALDGALAPHARQVFDSDDDFLERGLGAAVVLDGVLACAATSYGIGRRAVEIAIATRAKFRGRGFAASAAARLIADCLARGLEPCWNASNPVSQRLARRLGYREHTVCEVLYLP